MKQDALVMHQMTNTHILLQDFAYVEPRSLDEAISLLNQYGDRARVLAGGTYLLVQMKMEQQDPDYVINVQKLPELKGVSLGSRELRFGPCTPIFSVWQVPEVRAEYTALAEACAAFGSTQIQKMGTIGGNVCNGSPASDTVPALLALDASLGILGPAGERALSLEEFLLGPGETDLRPGEMLASIHLPRQRPATGSAFFKISRVAADLAKASAAAVLVRDGEHIVDCRLAFGSVGPVVLRATKAEELLRGQAFNPQLALQSGELASEEVSPIDDLRSTAWYRREIVKALTHDVLCVAWERAGGRLGRWANRPLSMARSASQDAQRTLGSVHVSPEQMHPIDLTVNGSKHRFWVAPNELLLNLLRERLELTGTKYGCGIGECGACTVHINGEPALACLTLAVAVDGCEVSTVEGLQGAGGDLDPLQSAFIEHQAFQCGYCTPGMLMMCKTLLNEVPAPSEDDVRNYLRGNRCRCTGFASIVRAVLSCAVPAGS